MSTTINNGGQVMTFDFKEQGTSRAFNKLNHRLFPQGILSMEGEVERGGNDTTVFIPPFRAVMQDDENKVNVNLYTTETATVAVSPSRPYVIGRWEWQDMEDSYMDFRAVSFTGSGEDSLQPTDIIFAKCLFESNGTLNTVFDTTRRTWSKDYYEGINSREPNFKVMSTESSEGNTNTVTVGMGSGFIGGKKVEFVEQQMSPAINLSISNSKKILVSINASGQIVLTESEDVAEAPVPPFPANMLTVAILNLPANPSFIRGDFIEYIYNNTPVQEETITTDTFDKEIARATKAEEDLGKKIQEEMERAVAKEGELSDKISTGSTSLSAEIQKVADNLKNYEEKTDKSIEDINTSKGEANGFASLDSTGRIPFSQLPESAMEYKGQWNASTNTPTLVDGTGTNGDFYICTKGGIVNFGSGDISFNANDRVIYTGTTQTWGRLSAGNVYTVNGRPASTDGNVIVNGSNIPLAYDTDSQTVAAAISSLRASITNIQGSTSNYSNLWKNKESRDLKKVLADLGDVSANVTTSVITSALQNRGNTENFDGLMMGDYFDFDSLGISSTGGSGSVSNDNSRLRFVIAGFNHYKDAGDTATGPGILFIAKNVVFQSRMNSSDTNNGGWAATELKGKFTSTLLPALTSALGVTPKTIHRILPTGTQGNNWAWLAEQVFIPTEGEVFGQKGWGNTGYCSGTSVQYPLFSIAPQSRIAYLGTSRWWWWEATSSSAASTTFCHCDNLGSANYTSASYTDRGVRFAFYL